jgi:mono/diheme cytochrome c family protein
MTDRALGVLMTVILLIGTACQDDDAIQTPAQLIAETDDACCPSPESVLANQMHLDDVDINIGTGLATASLIREGQGLYNTHGCAVCHGGSGRGDGPVAATLKPQPRDFRDPLAYTNGRTVRSIAKSINWGVAGSASVMPAFPHIPGDDRVKIAYYINSLQDQITDEH